MAGIKTAAGFDYKGIQPNFTRDMFNTIAEMKAFPDSSLPEVFIAVCKETPKVIYIYAKSNTVDPTTGKWRAFEGGVTLDDILDATSDNGVTNKVITEALSNKVDITQLGVATVTVKIGEDENGNDITKTVTGVATLDNSGKVPTSQLPSYVDDVVNGYYDDDYDVDYYDLADVQDGSEGLKVVVSLSEDAEVAATEILLTDVNTQVDPDLTTLVGDGTEYVVKKTKHITRTKLFYTDSTFSVELEKEDNKIYIDLVTERTFRWSGAIYVEISKSLVLGETVNTAFAGDKGKVAYTHAIDPDHAEAGAEKNVIVGVQVNGKDLEVNAESRKVNLEIGDTEVLQALGKNEEGALTFNGKPINGGEPSFFVTTSPVTNAIGDFMEGDEVGLSDKMSIVAAINKLLHKYISPSITVSTTPSTLLNEVGTEITSVIFGVNIAKGSEDIKKLIIKKDSIGIYELTSEEDLKDGGMFAYTYDVASIVDNTEFVVEVTDARNKVTTKTIKYEFVNKSYYGTVDADDIVDEAKIKSLNFILKKDQKLTYNDITGTNIKFVYAYPESMPALTSIKDANGFDYIASTTATSIEISGVSYRLYVLTNPTSVENFKQIYS